MQIIGSLFGLTAKIISAMIVLILVALLARSGKLDDAAGVVIALFMIPVQIVGAFIDILSSIDFGSLFGKS